MNPEKIKQDMQDVLANAKISEPLLQEALDEVLSMLDAQGHPQAVEVRHVCKEGAPLNRQAMDVLKNNAILLQTADDMAKMPELFELFATAMDEIAPPPTNSYLQIIASCQIKTDILACNNPMKEKFFAKYIV